jgi:hypothetical protein
MHHIPPGNTRCMNEAVRDRSKTTTIEFRSQVNDGGCICLTRKYLRVCARSFTTYFLESIESMNIFIKTFRNNFPCDGVTIKTIPRKRKDRQLQAICRYAKHKKQNNKLEGQERQLKLFHVTYTLLLLLLLLLLLSGNCVTSNNRKALIVCGRYKRKRHVFFLANILPTSFIKLR